MVPIGIRPSATSSSLNRFRIENPFLIWNAPGHVPMVLTREDRTSHGIDVSRCRILQRGAGLRRTPDSAES